MLNMDYRDAITSDKKFDVCITDIPYGINAGEMPFIKHINSPKQKNGNRLTTPEQKAVDLMSKFCDNVQTNRYNLSQIAAKQCSLITIDEIFEVYKSLSEDDDIMFQTEISYWNEVKKELEKY